MITANDRQRILDLIDRVYTNENDMPAFNELCRIFTPVINRNSKQYRRWITYMDIDDFLQEGYMVIWRVARRNPSSYYQPGHVDGYFIRSIQYHFINIFRSYVMKNIVIRGSEEMIDDTNIRWGREVLVEYRESLIARQIESSKKRKKWLLEHPEEAQKIRERYNRIAREKRRKANEENPEYIKRKRKEKKKQKKNIISLEEKEAIRKQHLDALREERNRKRRERYKSDPEYREKIKRRAKRYVEKNRAEVNRKALERYWAKKNISKDCN